MELQRSIWLVAPEEVLSIAGGPLDRGLAESLAGLKEAEALRARLRVAKLTRTVESGAGDLLDIYHGRIRDCLLGGIERERCDLTSQVDNCFLAESFSRSSCEWVQS